MSDSSEDNVLLVSAGWEGGVGFYTKVDRLGAFSWSGVGVQVFQFNLFSFLWDRFKVCVIERIAPGVVLHISGSERTSEGGRDGLSDTRSSMFHTGLFVFGGEIEFIAFNSVGGDVDFQFFRIEDTGGSGVNVKTEFGGSREGDDRVDFSSEFLGGVISSVGTEDRGEDRENSEAEDEEKREDGKISGQPKTDIKPVLMQFH